MLCSGIWHGVKRGDTTGDGGGGGSNNETVRDIGPAIRKVGTTIARTMQGRYDITFYSTYSRQIPHGLTPRGHTLSNNPTPHHRVRQSALPPRTSAPPFPARTPTECPTSEAGRTTSKAAQKSCSLTPPSPPSPTGQLSLLTPPAASPSFCLLSRSIGSSLPPTTPAVVTLKPSRVGRRPGGDAVTDLVRAAADLKLAMWCMAASRHRRSKSDPRYP